VAVTPDSSQWLSGGLDGMLATWDAMSQRRTSMFLAHTRPISAIIFDSDGQTLATASWDRSLALWKVGRERDSKQLNGHQDIVAGCGFTPDGKLLLSWSHDGSLRIWDTGHARMTGQLPGHEHRVTAAAISPDGRFAASAARDGALRLWDLETLRELGATRVAQEVRACLFLLDCESLVSVEANGRLAIYSVPNMEEVGSINVKLPLQCATLSPGGSQIALGCDDGKVRFISVEGLDSTPLLVTPTRKTQQKSTRLGWLFGKSRVEHSFSCTCPACRKRFDLAQVVPGQSGACPHCHRSLRMSHMSRLMPEA